jgi:hypothetical protein
VEPNSTVSTLVAAPVRLSSAQKRDLLGQAVAAVITTAMIAAPLVAPEPVSVLSVAERSAGSAPLPAVPVVALSAVPGTAILLAPAPVAPPRVRQRAAVRFDSVLTPPASVRAEEDLAAVTPYYTPVAAAQETPRRPLGRRLTGWLTGNGTHTIRPFPTVASLRQ